jgi:hypothetical protein
MLTAGYAAGQLVFLPTMAALATNAGWRIATVAPVAAVVALLPVTAVFMRDRPENLGLARYGDHNPSRPAAPTVGNPVAAAFSALASGVRSRDFWLIAAGYFACGATTNGLLGTHLIPACIDHGLRIAA